MMPDNKSKIHEIAVKLRFTPGALRALIGGVLMILGGLLTFWDRAAPLWDRLESLIPVLVVAAIVNALASTASPAAGPPLSVEVDYEYVSSIFADVTIGTTRSERRHALGIIGP